MWARIINAALGIWLMASPSVLGLGKSAKENSVVCGALAASFAIIAIWEVTRALRRLNSLIGIWLLIAPWFLGLAGEATVNSLGVGILMIVFSMFGGEVKENLGGGWSALFSGKENS